jgi:hypothetical protein
VPTLVARYRDYVLDAEVRPETIASYEAGLLLLGDGASYLLLDDGASRLIIRGGSAIQSPVLFAPHRDYILLAEEKE